MTGFRASWFEFEIEIYMRIERDIAATTENQMEKKTENPMELGWCTASNRRFGC